MRHDLWARRHHLLAWGAEARTLAPPDPPPPGPHNTLLPPLV
ncbi:hypothetical protein [Streptomyces phaeolivaceus]|nr:hypothetical protein [Streptomyces phaeolivaceus]